MEIKTLNKRTISAEDKRLTKKYISFQKMISELQKQDLPSAVIHSVNHQIQAINSFSAPDKKLLKQLTNAQSNILKLIENELKLVPKNHYRKLWMVLGMSCFGIPVGMALGFGTKNMGLLGVGLPLGMAIGWAIGAAMDKKVYENGKQLDLEVE